MNGFSDTTIDISDAELEFTLQQACVGTELDLGTGIELARAALTMRHAGTDPAAVFAVALRHFDTDKAETIFSRFPTVRRFATDLLPKPLQFPKFPSIARSSCSRYWRHEAAVDGWRWRTVTETRSLVAIHSPWRAVRCPPRWRLIRSSFVKNLPTTCWRTIVEPEMSARSTPHPGERFAFWRTNAGFADRRSRG